MYEVWRSGAGISFVDWLTSYAVSQTPTCPTFSSWGLVRGRSRKRRRRARGPHSPLPTISAVEALAIALERARRAALLAAPHQHVCGVPEPLLEKNLVLRQGRSSVNPHDDFDGSGSCPGRSPGRYRVLEMISLPTIFTVSAGAQFLLPAQPTAGSRDTLRVASPNRFPSWETGWRRARPCWENWSRFWTNRTPPGIRTTTSSLRWTRGRMYSTWLGSHQMRRATQDPRLSTRLNKIWTVSCQRIGTHGSGNVSVSWALPDSDLYFLLAYPRCYGSGGRGRWRCRRDRVWTDAQLTYVKEGQSVDKRSTPTGRAGHSRCQRG